MRNDVAETDRRGDDGRTTRFGHFLRLTSLDELPQLINVIRGEMSLVGPRPQVPELSQLYTGNQARRHEMKPGITGWAQINGRNRISWEQKYDFDVWYVDHHSLWLDLKILATTPLRLFRISEINGPYRWVGFTNIHQLSQCIQPVSEQSGSHPRDQGNISEFRTPTTCMKIVLFANSDWYIYNFRLSLALALRDAGHELLLVSPRGEYADELRSCGLRWEPVPLERRSLNLLGECRLLLHLVRLFEREKPDLVHSFTIKCVVYGSLAARATGVRARVNAITGLGFVFASTSLRAVLLRPALKSMLRVALGGRGARLVLQNSDDLATLDNAGLIARREVRLIRSSGVDTSRFRPHRRNRTTCSPMRVLLAARLIREKGVVEFVEAARRLKAEGRAIDFYIAGNPDPGNPASIDQKQVRAWVDEGLVNWLGHVDDMPSLLPQMDLNVLPSYREGVPRALIEAAACALPIIATDVPGCREVVTHERDGLLVPARNSQALADAIARLQDNPEMAGELGVAARQKALGEFDERLVISKTFNIYRELLENSSSRINVGSPVDRSDRVYRCVAEGEANTERGGPLFAASPGDPNTFLRRRPPH